MNYYHTRAKKFLSFFFLIFVHAHTLAYTATPDDLHIHLNGAFSLDFLRQTAAKNNKIIQYQAFLQEHRNMEKNIKEENYEALLPNIWTKFSLIHEIVQTHDDITLGTIDVIINHPSQYLEIRTTPKEINHQSLKTYIDAFIEGLNQGRAKSKELKVVKGILSIDRTKHTFEEALQIVELAAQYRDRKKPIVGIDISGNPSLQKRSITGIALKQVLEAAIEKKLCLAIHFAEASHLIEQKDSDTVLDVLEQWQKNALEQSSDASKHDFFYGKVRLGHVIFPSNVQIERIRQLNVPVEICPSGHQLIGWWKKNNKHPIHEIYPLPDSPVALGTDDPIIFNTNIKQEFLHLQTIYPSVKLDLAKRQDLRFNNVWS